MREHHSPKELQAQSLEIIRQLQRPRPTVIGIEGGPCGGKSSAINHIQREANIAGTPCIVIPEVATEVLNALELQGDDIAKLAREDRLAFLELEKAIMVGIKERVTAARTSLVGTDGRIILDRTTIRPYVTRDEYATILSDPLMEGFDPQSVIDKMIYLPSIAQFDTERYEQLKLTNPTRYETAVQAKVTCKSNLSAIRTHPELHVVTNDDFSKVLSDVAKIALHDDEFEGKWQPGDIGPSQTKGMRVILSDKAVKGELLDVSVIEQSYHHVGMLTFRLRHIKSFSDTERFIFTIKNGSGQTRTESSRTITAAEYGLLYSTSPLLGRLQKYRTSFLDDWRVWVADYVPALPEGQQWFIETETATAGDLKGLRPSFMTTEPCNVDMFTLAQNLA